MFHTAFHFIWPVFSEFVKVGDISWDGGAANIIECLSKYKVGFRGIAQSVVLVDECSNRGFREGIPHNMLDVSVFTWCKRVFQIQSILYSASCAFQSLDFSLN